MKLLKLSLVVSVLFGAGSAFASDCAAGCDQIPAACAKSCDQTAKSNANMCKAKCDEAAATCKKRCETKKNKN